MFVTVFFLSGQNIIWKWSFSSFFSRLSSLNDAYLLKREWLSSRFILRTREILLIFLPVVLDQEKLLCQSSSKINQWRTTVSSLALMTNISRQSTTQDNIEHCLLNDASISRREAKSLFSLGLSFFIQLEKIMAQVASPYPSSSIIWNWSRSTERERKIKIRSSHLLIFSCFPRRALLRKEIWHTRDIPHHV